MTEWHNGDGVYTMLMRGKRKHYKDVRYVKSLKRIKVGSYPKIKQW